MNNDQARRLERPVPPLSVHRTPIGVRLRLGGLAHGEGNDLQAAADDLVQRLLTYAMAFRSSGVRMTPETGPVDLAELDLLYELGEIAARGGDIRERLFG